MFQICFRANHNQGRLFKISKIIQNFDQKYISGHVMPCTQNCHLNSNSTHCRVSRNIRVIFKEEGFFLFQGKTLWVTPSGALCSDGSGGCLDGIGGFQEVLGVILRLLGTICSFLSSWIKLKLSPCGFPLSSEGSCFLILDEIGSCNEITTALIQISRLFYFGFFSKTNLQMIIVFRSKSKWFKDPKIQKYSLSLFKKDNL